ERGAHGNVLNVPLASGSGDALFLGAWEKKIGPALAEFHPELLLVSAGFDAHEDDPLAGLQVTTEGYRELATLIKGWAIEHTDGRTVWALEGGYNLKALGAPCWRCCSSSPPCRRTRMIPARLPIGWRRCRRNRRGSINGWPPSKDSRARYGKPWQRSKPSSH